ncbi:MAG: ABC transporter permease, partial [Vicinamibacterales bacterium]
MSKRAWWRLFSARRRDREIAEEIQTHLDMATRDRIERGESPDAARLAAMREFGNVGLIRQATRETWSWTWLEQLLQDMRFGARILWHSPGVSATAILLVALVIGGNTTIYSIVRNILTRPASGVEADGLVCINQVSPDSDRLGPYLSYPNYLDYAAQSRTVRRLSGWSSERLTLGVDSGSYAVYGAFVTSGYFETLGVRMAAGRALRPDDDRLETGLVAVISDRIWSDRFERAHDVVGRRITVNGNPATVVGVSTPRFRGATLTPGEDVWLPIAAYYDAIGSKAVLHNRAQWTVLLVGQRAPGVSLAQAQAEIGALSARLEAAYPVDNKDRRAVVSAYSATAMLPVARMAPVFLALFSVITVLTLLIVSANVANLMLARAVVRQRETAVRQSLGASRARILRMLVA